MDYLNSIEMTSTKSIMQNAHSSYKLFWQILMGISLTISVNTLYEKTMRNGCSSIECDITIIHFIIFVFTFLRFFWGDLRYIDIHYSETFAKNFKVSGVKRYSDILILTVHGITFMLLGYCIHKPVDFYILYAVLMFTNIMWVFYDPFLAPGLKLDVLRNSQSINIHKVFKDYGPVGWILNNILTLILLMLICILCYRFSWTENNKLSCYFIIIIVLISNSIFDYSLTWKFYFPMIKTTELKTNFPMMTKKFIQAAIEEARKGLSEGGIPIGSVLVYKNEIIGRGHNKRIQEDSVIKHGEMDALENAGRRPAFVYAESTLYTTLSPCPMCSGAIRLYGIKNIIIGENKSFLGDEETLKNEGFNIQVLQNEECISLMTEYIKKNPKIWNEDIGE